MLNENRWRRLWMRLGGRDDSAVSFLKLKHGYAEPHRHYHNAAHITDCLEQFDGARRMAEQPDEVEAAIWFHDAVYDPRANDNEVRSAEWAIRELVQAGVDTEVIERIAALIRATQHNVPPATRDSELLLDVDLSILGRVAEEFAAYDRAIRQEYGWVPEESYRVGRAKVLGSFLNRPCIYSTVHFQDKFEVEARRNLERAIGELRR
jgi:predicted metal-dependent HD superfamily phosphohydrolase